jgi:hypothetical protein
MTTNVSATLTAMWLGAALLALPPAALPAVAVADSVGCSPATCTSPVVGPGHHLDVETR